MTKFEIVVRQRDPVASLLLRCVVLLLLAAVIAIASGCATLTGTSMQAVDIVTVDVRDRLVAGMHCEVTHNGGIESFKSPNATLSIRRGSEPLEIECTRGESIARGTAIARGENAMAHSFIPGGAFGAMIDHLSGHMYSYPTPLRLRVGEHLRFEHSDAATATLVAPVGSQLAAGNVVPIRPTAAVTAPTVAASAVSAGAVKATPIAPARAKPVAPAPAARPPVVGDSLDARDLRLRAAMEKE